MNAQSLPGERQIVSKTVIGVGLLMMIAGVGLGGSQAWRRFADGYWTPYSMTRMFADLGISSPHGAWESVQPTIDWIMYEPAWGVMLSAGLVVVAVGRVAMGLFR